MKIEREYRVVSIETTVTEHSVRADSLENAKIRVRKSVVEGNDENEYYSVSSVDVGGEWFIDEPQTTLSNTLAV